METLQFGIQPFWFWNGEMDEEEMTRQIEEMKKEGLKGFMIHPRQGLELPYLSEKFFDRVRHAVAEAKKRGMEVWLYDEFPYPSGIGGGEVVLEHPEYLCKALEYVTGEAKQGETIKLYAPWGKVLCARAYRQNRGKTDWGRYIDVSGYIGTGYRQDVFQLSGLTKYNKKRFFQGDMSKYLNWTAPEGDWKIYVFVETVMTHFKYFETFMDPLNPDAVRYYLETTHERYKKYIGDEFGKTVKGVFTDEVTAFPPQQPWSPLLAGLIKEKEKLDILEYLPALFEDMGEITARVRYAYWNTAANQFIDSYDKQVLSWCHENHLLYIGEKPILRSKELEFVDIPGIDAGHQKVGSHPRIADETYRHNGKIASSAAHFYGKEGAICEAFHSIGWGMTAQDMKWIFDWLTVSGINWFATHGAYYTTDGLRKHDAPPSSFYQMPWWRNVHQVSAHVEKLGAFLKKERSVQALVIDPVTTVWTADASIAPRLKGDFAGLQNAILEAGLDYYIADPQLLERSRMEKRDGKIWLCLGEDAYDTVILPFMANIEGAADRVLAPFIEAGGRCAFLGCVPFEKIEEDGICLTAGLGLDGREIYENYCNGRSNQDVRKENLLFTEDTGTLLAFLREAAVVNWEFSSPLKEDGSLVGIQAKGDGEETELFLLNLSGKEGEVELRYRKGDAMTLFLAPYESRFMKPREVFGEAGEAEEFQEISLEEAMLQKLSVCNALRLGMWQMETEDGQTAQADSFPMIDQLASAGIKIPVRQKPYFGCPKELELGRIKAEYKNEFFCEKSGISGEIYLVMEPTALLGSWRLQVNGCEIRETDFRTKEIYMNTNLAAEVSGMLRDGRNEIALEIETEVSFGGIRNPLYLCGNFSVFQKEGLWSLEKPVERGYIKDRAGSGLPFYAGRIVYETTIELEKEKLVIRDAWLEDAVSILVDGKDAGSRAFSPYRFTIPEGAAAQGRHKLTIMLDTTLLELFEGQRWNQKLHCYETCETGREML